MVCHREVTTVGDWCNVEILEAVHRHRKSCSGLGKSPEAGVDASTPLRRLVFCTFPLGILFSTQYDTSIRS